MSSNKPIIIGLILVIVIVCGMYFLFRQNPPKVTAPVTENQNTQNTNTSLQSYDIQGMKVEILKEGTGEPAKVGDRVLVHYTGTLQDGTKFDSSLDRGEPFPMTLGENKVIKGWELGVLGMKAGEKRRLTIPPELAYGDREVGGVIPANSTLIFDIEMLSINK